MFLWFSLSSKYPERDRQVSAENQTPVACVTGGHSAKELSRQLNNLYILSRLKRLIKFFHCNDVPCSGVKKYEKYCWASIHLTQLSNLDIFSEIRISQSQTQMHYPFCQLDVASRLYGCVIKINKQKGQKRLAAFWFYFPTIK